MVILLELRREMHKDKLRKKLKIPEVEEKKEEKKRDWLKWLLLALVLFVIIKRR